MGLFSRRRERAPEPDIDTAPPGFWDKLPPALPVEIEEPDLPPAPEDIEQGAEPLDALQPDRRVDLDAYLEAPDVP